MSRELPPRWLQRTLLFFLAGRDHEAISGDLLEAYREDQLPHFGFWRANWWYLRQSISFASIRFWGGPRLRRILVLLCLFAVAAGTWLGVMESILKHDGYAQRTAMAAYIALQAVATLLFLLLNGRPALRGLIITGAVGIALLGASAVYRIGQSQHFEGFVLVIGLALMLQGALTVAVLLRTQNGKAA